MKKLKLTILYLFGFAALLLVFTVVINLSVFDEELLPEVEAIKNIKAEPYDENNAYPALIAINGPSGKTLKDTSNEVREFLNYKIKTTGIDYLSHEEMDSLIGKNHDKSWQNSYDSCNSRTNKNCMEKLHADLLELPINDERLIAQLARYEAFIQYQDFKESTQLDLTAPIGPYAPLINIKRLFLADSYINHSSEIYIGRVLQDMRFWRMVLSKGHLLITEMIAIATLSDDINSLSEAIKQGALDSEQLNKLQGLITVLSKDETNFRRVFEFEFKFGLHLLDEAEQTDNLGSAFDRLFYQPNATHNLNYNFNTKPMKKMAALNAYEFYNYTASEQFQQDFKSPVGWSPTILYNPLGKFLMTVAMPAYKDYIGRMHDLNGLFYLLKLQIEIALNQDKAVKQVIANSKYTNPFTLEPMSYNSESHSIGFDCVDKTSICELDL